MTFRMNCIDDDFIEVERTTRNTYRINVWCDVWEDLLIIMNCMDDLIVVEEGRL